MEGSQESVDLKTIKSTLVEFGNIPTVFRGKVDSLQKP